MARIVPEQFTGRRIRGVQQKGLPTSAIYRKDMQDANDKSIPQDVQERLLLFAKAGPAAAEMRGKSYSFDPLGFHGHRRVS